MLVYLVLEYLGVKGFFGLFGYWSYLYKGCCSVGCRMDGCMGVFIYRKSYIWEFEYEVSGGRVKMDVCCSNMIHLKVFGLIVDAWSV